MNDDQDISKTEKKRRAARLQELGKSLTALPDTALDTFNLTSDLRSAISDYQRFSGNEAKRRQLQFIGKLMRKEDAEAIAARLQDIEGNSAAARYEFHQLERWRDRLLAEPDALTEYLREAPGTDRQALRHHIQRAHRARDETQRRAAQRALFRFLRDAPDPD